jgi:hypothetical protein
MGTAIRQHQLARDLGNIVASFTQSTHTPQILLQCRRPAKSNPARGLLANRNCKCNRLPLFELARVLVRFDHIASFIVNTDHSIM